MQNDDARYLLWAVMLCFLFLFFDFMPGQTHTLPQDVGGKKYQEMKASGQLATQPKTVHFPKKLRPENIIHPTVTKSGGGLLIPIDGGFYNRSVF